MAPTSDYVIHYLLENHQNVFVRTAIPSFDDDAIITQSSEPKMDRYSLLWCELDSSWSVNIIFFSESPEAVNSYWKRDTAILGFVWYNYNEL